MTLNPITLPSSKVLSTLTTFIVDMRLEGNIKSSRLCRDLIDSFRVGKVDVGKGITFTFKTELPTTKDLTETSSLLTISKPKLHQETILIDKYKMIPISWSQELASDAVTKGSLIYDFSTYVFSMAEEAEEEFVYNECLSQMKAFYDDKVNLKVNQKLTIAKSTYEVTTQAEANAQAEFNATSVAKQIRLLLNNWRMYSNDYNEYDKDGNGSYNKLEDVDTILYVSDIYWTNYLADALASIYHAERIGDMIDTGRIVLIPENQVAKIVGEANKNKFVGMLVQGQKFALAESYRLQLSFMDASTLYTNSFLHFSYGLGTFASKNGVIIEYDK